MIGRPRKEITRCIEIKVRLTPNEYDILNEICGSCNITYSEAFRKGMLDYYKCLNIGGRISE